MIKDSPEPGKYAFSQSDVESYPANKHERLVFYSRLSVKKVKKKIYGTRYSQAVTHLSTNRARRCLTSVIRREPVFSTWYGCRHL